MQTVGAVGVWLADNFPSLTVLEAGGANLAASSLLIEPKDDTIGPGGATFLRSPGV